MVKMLRPSRANLSLEIWFGQVTRSVDTLPAERSVISFLRSFPLGDQEVVGMARPTRKCIVGTKSVVVIDLLNEFHERKNDPRTVKIFIFTLEEGYLEKIPAYINENIILKYQTKLMNYQVLNIILEVTVLFVIVYLNF